MKSMFFLMLVFLATLVNNPPAKGAPTTWDSLKDACVFEPPLAVRSLIQAHPEEFLGPYPLLTSNEHCVTFHPAFLGLLRFLGESNYLKASPSQLSTLAGLNAALQKNDGGFLRDASKELFDLQDNAFLTKNGPTIKMALKELGFEKEVPLADPLYAHHVLVFGARVQRMIERLTETLAYLSSGRVQADALDLLGSNRKLSDPEMPVLTQVLADGLKKGNLTAEEHKQWEKRFADPANRTEGNAFVALYEAIASPKFKKDFAAKLIAINTTKIGVGFPGGFGVRPTTETTVIDWKTHYSKDKPQTIFSVVEQPFLRLVDTLRWSVLSDGQKADLPEIKRRLIKDRFVYVVTPGNTTRMSVYLDGMARNIYNVNTRLNYLAQVGN